MDGKKYLKIVFGAAGALVLCVAAVNFSIDPLGIYREDGVHPAASYYARIKKIEDVKRLRPDAIITGTSRADIGLDPRPEFFPGLTPYNFALPASSIHEQRLALEFAQAARPLKEAVITLDFFAFDARRLENKGFDPVRLSPEALAPARSFADTYESAFSLDMLAATFKHLRSMRHPERFADIEADGHTTVGDMEYDISLHGAGRLFGKPGNAGEISADDFALGRAPFADFEAMLEMARKNGIKVFLIISPVHETYLETLEASGKGPLVAEWKKRVAGIVRANGVKYGAAPYPLWDFAYPNAITSERVPADDDVKGRMKWFWDSNHYKTELGDAVLRKVLRGSGERPGFGERLD